MKTSTPLLIAIALILTLGAVLLGQLIGGTSERLAETTDGQSEILVEEIRNLRRTQERTAASLEGLAQALDRLSWPNAPASSTRESEGPLPATSFDALIASLDLLRESLEKESAQTRELIRGMPGSKSESLAETRKRKTAPDWLALTELERSWRTDADQANRSQYFQTAQDLLEAYGTPTEIFRPKGGVLFYYRRHPEGSAGPAWYFRLQDSMVVEFWIEDEVTGE